MEDRTVLIKMAISTLAGLLFFDFAVFTTMLDLPIFWRNIWLGFCITFFVVAVAGVFVLCGHLNSAHSIPIDAKPTESWLLRRPIIGLLVTSIALLLPAVVRGPCRSWVTL